MRKEASLKESRTIVAGVNNDEFPDNKIRNTKYTLLTFLPLNLYEQFHLPMNAYFLLIAFLQLWSEVTAANPLTTWLPLLFIFAVSAIREACDDIKRSKADKMANSKIIRCVRDGEIKEVKSEDIKVGDIIYLEKDEEIPCDLVVLNTSNNGSCFIQTANIDGETDLKIRQAPKLTQKVLKNPQDYKSISLRVHCPPPDCHIYQFDASMEFNKETISISSDNLLLQVTRVKNTDYIYGICVYTGNETKFGMNKSIQPPKITKFDQIINYFSVFIFCLQLLLAIILGIMGSYIYKLPQPWYLTRTNLYDSLSWIIFPLRFLLLNSSMIPISLKVTMEISKVFYSAFIEKDQDFNADSKNVYYNSSYLVEGLGQIKYIFTDKTGTLTKNEMKLKTIYTNKQIYKIESAYIHKENVNEDVQMFIRNIMLNNTLKISQEQSSICYNGVSPEEVCTVSALGSLGRLYSHEESTGEINIDVFGNNERYKIIHLQEFNSNRKRTSVIVYDYQKKQYILFAKGADDVILPRCIDIYMGKTNGQSKVSSSQEDSYDSESNDITVYNAVDHFCGQGLRALTYSYRFMSNEEIHKVLESIKEAENVLKNREQAKDTVYETFEKDMYVCGACGIEDALQDNVNESIQQLKNGNMHIWMITGDKPKTALEIGKTTGIISRSLPDENVLLLEGSSKIELYNTIERYIKQIEERKSEISVYVAEDSNYTDSSMFSLIVTGYTLVYILDKYTKSDIKCFKHLHNPSNHYKDVDIYNNEDDLSLLLYIRFYDLCLLMDSIICSRVTPKQKADIVNIIKTNSSDVCLSIGDGGNDVNMIQTANIGIGIEGKEGKQAARASDYVLSEFQYLPRLLLYHGYNSYRRSSYICLYSYFKSIVFCLIQSLYNTTTMVSGIAVFNSLYMSFYNVILFIPIMAMTTDKYDIENRKNANYYKETQNNGFISITTFFFYFVIAILIALIFYFITSTLYPSYSFDDYGNVTFFNNLLVQDIIMLLFTHSVTIYNIVCILFSHVLFTFFAGVMNVMYSFKGFIPYLSFNSTYSYVFTYINKGISVCFCLLVYILAKSYMSTHKHRFSVHI